MKNIFFVCIYFLSNFRAGSSRNQEIMIFSCESEHPDGLFCDVKNKMFFYVDTLQAKVYRYYEWRNKLIHYKLEGHKTVAAIIPYRENDDEFIVAADRQLHKLTWPDYLYPDYRPTKKNASIEELLTLENKRVQFNYGKVDNRGRLWLGTVLRKTSNESIFYVFSGENLENFKAAAPNVINGMAWSINGKRFYVSVSSQRVVLGYNFHKETGKFDTPKIVFDMRNYPKLKGTPYGMTIDTNGNLWIALFGGHSVINVNPRTSRVIRVIEMFVTHVTSVCLGGPDIDLLYVATSRRYLNDPSVEHLHDDPQLSGCVLGVYVVPKKGLLDNKFNTTDC